MMELCEINEMLLTEFSSGAIVEMERQMMDMPQVEMPIEDLYFNGMYARKILIPEGTILTGRVHKNDYINVMVSGDIAVTTGEDVKRFDAFELIPGKAGQKRAGYAFTDTVWLTIDPADHEEDDMVDLISCTNVAQFKKWQNNLLGGAS